MINGIKGSNSRYGDSEWLGFWGEDIEIEIEFETEVELDEIELRFYNAPGQWIYSPERYEIVLKTDFDETVIDRMDVKNNSNSIFEVNHKLFTPKAFTPKYKKMTIKIPNYGIIPDGNQGAGNKAWTFIDEIIIK